MFTVESDCSQSTDRDFYIILTTLEHGCSFLGISASTSTVQFGKNKKPRRAPVSQWAWAAIWTSRTQPRPSSGPRRPGFQNLTDRPFCSPPAASPFMCLDRFISLRFKTLLSHVKKSPTVFHPLILCDEWNRCTKVPAKLGWYVPISGFYGVNRLLYRSLHLSPF